MKNWWAVIFCMAIQLSHYCFLNSLSFSLCDLKCYLFWMTYTYFIYSLWILHVGGFDSRLSLLSHCYCQYHNILIMEALLCTLISAMPSPLLITLLSHGIPGCSFFVCSSKQHISILFIFKEKTDGILVVNALNCLLGRTDNFMMLSLFI